jgi:hypothetical protein
MHIMFEDVSKAGHIERSLELPLGRLQTKRELLFASSLVITKVKLHLCDLWSLEIDKRK